MSPFFIYLSFLLFSVYFFHHELFLKLDNLIVMASLRCSVADESEDTLNFFTSHTDQERRDPVGAGRIWSWWGGLVPFRIRI